MSHEREEFEKWCKDYFVCDEQTFNVEPQFGYYSSISSNTFQGKKPPRYSDVWMLFEAWQACASLKDKRITELEADKARLLDEARYFNRKLTEVTVRHCDEIEKCYRLKCKLLDASTLVNSITKERKLLEARIDEHGKGNEFLYSYTKRGEELRAQLAALKGE